MAESTPESPPESPVKDRPFPAFPLSRMRTSTIMEDELSHRTQSQNTSSSTENAVPSIPSIKNEKPPEQPPQDKPPLLARIQAKTGLNTRVLIAMFKGCLPPVISIAMYESTSVADTYSTIGYVISIMAALSLPMLPRAKFLQMMFLNIVLTCAAAAVTLLQIYCATQARAHTTHAPPPTANGPTPGTRLAPYNSSASAICAIWLFVQIYAISVARAACPHLLFPVIMWGIFTNIASIYAPTFPTMDVGINFTERLLESFLTGYGLAVGVSLFIFPTTVRMTFFAQSTGFIKLVQGTLKAQMAYLHTLEKIDIFAILERAKEARMHPGKEPSLAKPTSNPEKQKLKELVAKLSELHGKMNGDLTFAKREVAFGKLNASDISELFKHIQDIFLPLTGMSSAADIFERIADKWGQAELDTSPLGIQRSRESVVFELNDQWNEIIRTLHDPFETMTEAMQAGLQHSLYALELAKPPKKQAMNNQRTSKVFSDDVEGGAVGIKPGDPGYSKYLETKVKAFYEDRKATLASYCQEEGIQLDPKSFRNSAAIIGNRQFKRNSQDEIVHQRNKRQLYLVLYMEFLLSSAGRAVLSLAQFADQKVEDGTMKRKRLILPGFKRMKKWLITLFNNEGEGSDDTLNITQASGARIYGGQSFEKAKDPDHLPPANRWERIGNVLRKAGGIFGSSHSAYGLRVAMATISVTIMAFLANTQEWFITQRIIWGTVMIAIGMTVSAGDGVFGFFARIGGTVLALVTSLIVWYIVDGHTAGVIVFNFVFMFAEFYFMIYPRFLIIALVTIVTQALIIGYELEVKKVGQKVATANLQPYYSIAKLSAYRVATVAGGMLVCFIWTYFPYPITARSLLRKDLGASLYLLANFYGAVHTTFGMRLRAVDGDTKFREVPNKKLDKARTDIYVKEMKLLAEVKEQCEWTKWEPSFGGKFPRKEYVAILQEVHNILNYLSLMSYASRSLVHENNSPNNPNQATWLQDFSRLVGSISVTSHEITSILTLLSAAVTNGNSLPPYLKPPRAYELSRKLEELDADILSITHVAEPGYSAFAVIQIASSLVSDDLGKLISNVKALVGEVDFSFHVMSTAHSSESMLLNRATTL
ncbi:hypothetical protein ACLMJK_000786 [Lecanora helva]